MSLFSEKWGLFTKPSSPNGIWDTLEQIESSPLADDSSRKRVQRGVAVGKQSMSGTGPLPPVRTAANEGRPGGRGGRRPVWWFWQERIIILAAAFVFAACSGDSCWWGGGIFDAGPFPRPCVVAAAGWFIATLILVGRPSEDGWFEAANWEVWTCRPASHYCNLGPCTADSLSSCTSRANPRTKWWRIIWWVGHHGGLWCIVSLLCICASAYLRIFVVHAPTKPPRKQQKYRKHRLMEIAPKCSFVNLCIYLCAI